MHLRSGCAFPGWIFFPAEGEFHFIHDQEDWIAENSFALKDFRPSLLGKSDFFALAKKFPLLHLDVNVPQWVHEELKKIANEIVFVNPVHELNFKDVHSLKKIFHQLEMSVIYAYGLLREGLTLEEIIHEIRDYLWLKSKRLVKLRVNVRFFKNQQEQVVLSKNNHVVFSIWLQDGRVASHYYKTIFFNHSSKKLLKLYQSGREILSSLKNFITASLENHFPSKQPLEQNWQIAFKNVFEQQDFSPLREEFPKRGLLRDFQDFQGFHFYNLKVKHSLYQFVLGDAFIVSDKTNKTNKIIANQKKVLFLDSFSNELLHFPW